MDHPSLRLRKLYFGMAKKIEIVRIHTIGMELVGLTRLRTKEDVVFGERWFSKVKSNILPVENTDHE